MRTRVLLVSLTITACMGPAGQPGQDGSKCKVEQQDDGSALITCDDGSSATVLPGADGAAGEGCTAIPSEDEEGAYLIDCPGSDPVTIHSGSEGPAGENCRAEAGEDEQGTFYTITCPDSDPVVIRDGADGQNCSASTDEESGDVTISCPGQDDVVIRAPANGEPCTVEQNDDNSLSINCPGQDPVVIPAHCSHEDDGRGTLTIQCGDDEPILVAYPFCGNERIEPGEECDDGNEANDDHCVAGCVHASCGDGFVRTQAGMPNGWVETCDDGPAEECAEDCRGESSNTPATAVRVYVGEVRSAAIDPDGEVDYYSFTAPADGSYRLSSRFVEGGRTDTYAILYDPEGNELTRNDDGLEDDGWGEGSNFMIVAELEEGQEVILQVRHFSMLLTGPYVLGVQHLGVCGNGELDEGESCDDGNDSWLDACLNDCVTARCGDGHTRQDLEAGEEGHETCDDDLDEDCGEDCQARGDEMGDAYRLTLGLVHVAHRHEDDVEYYTFTTAEAGRYHIGTSSNQDVQGIDSVCQLFNAQGEEIAENDDGPSYGPFGGGTNCGFDLELPADSQYYLHIRPWGGNPVAGYLVRAARINICGNGVTDEGEACDDRNDDNTDACLDDCTVASCGDGHTRADIEAGEENYEACDDGNVLNNDACVEGCVEAFCGDQFVHDGEEECDDGNDIDTDECLNDCSEASCGDGVVQIGEQCDDGNGDDDDRCRNNCTFVDINVTNGREIAFGHHGQCEGWNGCETAEGCANMACNYLGHGPARRYEVVVHNCDANVPTWNLFHDANRLHENWTDNCNWCPLSGVTDLYCTPEAEEEEEED